MIFVHILLSVPRPIGAYNVVGNNVRYYFNIDYKICNLNIIYLNNIIAQYVFNVCNIYKYHIKFICN